MTRNEVGEPSYTGTCAIIWAMRITGMTGGFQTCDTSYSR